MTKKYPGFLIAFEGIDGSGKTTLSRLVHQYLLQYYPDAVLTKEPGGTVAGQKIRTLVHEQTFCPEAEFLLFAADRAEHVKRLVIPALECGALVISDRMADSSRAYQGYGRGLDRAFIESILNFVMAGVKPDLVVYVNIDQETAVKRIAQRNEALTSFEQEKKDFYARVIAGFDELFAHRSDVIMVDGILPVNELVLHIVTSIQQRLS